MNKANQGEISVYACAMTAVLLTLILAVLVGIHVWEARAKCYQSVDASVDSLKGDYQPDLFRRYHLLAIDQTYYGRGQGYMEERLEEYLNHNLNSEQSLYRFDIDDVIITDTQLLTEESLTGMKQQIQEYMKQKLLVDVAGMLFGDSTQEEMGDGLNDAWNQAMESSQSDSIVDMSSVLTEEDMEAVGILEDVRNSGVEDINSITINDLIDLNQENGFLNDPRNVLDTLQQSGILYLVMPDRASAISGAEIDLQNVPSNDYTYSSFLCETPDFSDITSITELTGLLSADSELQDFDSSNYALEELYGIAYIMDAFQGVQNSFYQEDGEYHTFEYEVEYILEGKSSDSENVTAVAYQLLFLRLVPNLAYAFTNEDMKTAATLAATVLLTPIYMEALIEPVSYVFLTCWAYGESLMDVKCLFQGGRVPLIKDADSWQLSLNGIAEIATQEAKSSEDEEGWNYSEYLAVLLLIMPDSDLKYYRMLDIMELNIQGDIPAFDIENCIYGFHVQAEIHEQEYVWYVNGEGSYIKCESSPI